jgi:hypothetical protein
VRASGAGDRFVILGELLLLFDGSRTVLRDFGPPPEGYRYSRAAFSPDGSQFAYVLQPAALFYY